MTAATLYRPAGYGLTAYVPSGPLRAGDILTSPRTGQRFVFRYAVSRTTATAFGQDRGLADPAGLHQRDAGRLHRKPLRHRVRRPPQGGLTPARANLPPLGAINHPPAKPAQ